VKKPFLTNLLPNHLANVTCLLSLLTTLAACAFRQPEATLVPFVHEDTAGCLASQQQVSSRTCLTAVYHARFVNAYTLGQLQ
jgi:hypothetical protein